MWPFKDPWNSVTIFDVWLYLSRKSCQVIGLINNSLEPVEFLQIWISQLLRSPLGNRYRKAKGARQWIYFSIIYFHSILRSPKVIYHIPNLITQFKVGKHWWPRWGNIISCEMLMRISWKTKNPGILDFHKSIWSRF